MNWLQRLRGKKRLESELDKELADHLVRQASDLRGSGVPDAEAHRKARLIFGGFEQIREECRDARGTRWLESSLQDARLACRGFLKSPGFTLTAIATLALGIGANTAIFTLLDAVRLRSLPVPKPDELARISIAGGARFGVVDESDAVSYPMWQQIRDHQRGFSSVFAWAPNSFELGKGASERHVDGLWITGEFFPALGVRPVRGRVFTAADDRNGCGVPGAVISYAFWQSEFGGRDSAIGSKLFVQGHSTEVVGIAPPSFTGLEVGKNFAFALPLCSFPAYSPGDDSLRRADDSFLLVMGRRRAAWTLSQAREQLASVSPAIFEATLPSGYEAFPRAVYLKSRLTAEPAANGISGLREAYDTSLFLLLGITGLVLLIACANLANLMLVRGGRREREMAVRLAIGASRVRLIRQLMTEALALALAGAAVGAAFAHLLGLALVAFVSTERDSLYLDLAMNWHVLAFAGVIAVTTCLVFGVVPALRSSQTDPGEALKAGARTTTGTLRRRRSQNVLVVSQVAISLVLLITAILFVRSFWNLATLDPGFREKGIFVASVDFSHLPKQVSKQGVPLDWTDERAAAYVRNVIEQLRELPQVASAGASTHVPLDGSSWTLGFSLPTAKSEAKFTWVSPGYFKTMEKPLLSGRDFNDRDSSDSPRVAVVNQAFVRQNLARGKPIGLTLRTIAEPNYPAREYQIVGVVKDAKYAALREEIPPEVFGSIQQFGVSEVQNVFIRPASTPASGIAAVRRKLNEISPDIRSSFSIFEADIRDHLVRERLMAVLSGFFGALSALLAAIGLYGVMSYIVAGRSGEIGIRLALGASRLSIIETVLRPAAALVLIGVACGLLLGLAAGVAARSLLFGLKANDAATFGAATLLLIAVAVVASFLPAHRASRLDPITALRYE